MSYYEKLKKILGFEDEKQLEFNFQVTGTLYSSNPEDLEYFKKRIKKAVLKHSVSKLNNQEKGLKNGTQADR